MQLDNLPAHGGDIYWASITFNRPQNEWLDLSTGISPWSWPVPDIPQHIYQQLPHNTNDLTSAASLYYQCSEQDIVILPGSQFAIETIPSLVPVGHIAMPYWGYSEHRLAWQRQGHHITFYRDINELLDLCSHGLVTYAVVINPNNPDTTTLTPDQLQQVETTLSKTSPNNHLLVIDEAFIDTCSEQSFIPHRQSENTVILRSLGKYFGLAGLRIGFAITTGHWHQRLTNAVGLWLCSHPSLYIATRALTDHQWVSHQKRRIQQQSRCLEQALRLRFPDQTLHCSALFHTLFGTRNTLTKLFMRAAENGVLLRLIDAPHTQAKHTLALRIGLPAVNVEQIIPLLG